MKYSIPLVGRPIELIIPPSTSDTRGGGLPARNSRETVFATRAPSRFKSITCARSVEKHPDAGMIGFLSVTLPIFTLMSTIRPPPGDRTPARRCTRDARSEEHTSELQSRRDLVCRLLLEKKKKNILRLFVLKKKKNKQKN